MHSTMTRPMKATIAATKVFTAEQIAQHEARERALMEEAPFADTDPIEKMCRMYANTTSEITMIAANGVATR